MKDVLPGWTFVSLNRDAAESVLALDESTDAPPFIQLMQNPTSGDDHFRHARYLLIEAAMSTSTAGFTRAKSGAAL